MKKLFFSAVALVAFSSVSMANTDLVKETEVDTAVNCYLWAADALCLMDADNSMSDLTAHDAYQDLLAICEHYQLYNLGAGPR
ncbi:hypothetical protein WFZ85_10425 [Flavobacterium sp. j3]|uniref:Uncharacterized protein n=1 Tax=Flavobacterium aureirubrum TaxID=3133147 RepID=A0ABU9N8E2_9FLAO